MSCDIEFKKLHPDARLPTPATKDSAGFDLYAMEGGRLVPGERKLVKTGIAMALEPFSVGLICPRSGLALKRGVTVLNAPGVIDADYRGELGVILVNLSQERFYYDVGDRIAQLVVFRYPLVRAWEVDELSPTDRGSGGFGSSGV